MAVVLVGASAGAGVVARAQGGAAGSNPTPYAPASVNRGKTFFLQNCQSCHDEDGKARSAAVAIAADLTAPERWKFGTGDAAHLRTNIASLLKAPLPQADRDKLTALFGHLAIGVGLDSNLGPAAAR